MKQRLRKLLAVLLSLTLLGGTLTVLAEAPEEPVVAEEPEPMPEAVPEPAPEVPAEPIPEPPAEAVPETPAEPAPEAPSVDETQAPAEPPAEPEGTAVPEAPVEPEVSALPAQDPDPEAPAEPLLPAEALAAGLGITVEELAADLGVTADELLLMDEETLNELYTQAHADEYAIEPIAEDGFEIDENGVLTKYTGPGGEVVIPDSVTSIGDSAFSGYYNITSIKIPDGVTSIGSSAFSGCYALAGIELPVNLTHIGDHAFSECTKLPNMKIPAGVTSIEEGTFSDCSSLESIDIPSTVTSIGNSAFEACHALNGVQLPQGITAINDNTFASCESLQTIDIPDGVTSIGYYAFENSGLSGVIDIPSSVTTIGMGAFIACYGLKRVTLYDTVEEIGLHAFLSNSYVEDPPEFVIYSSNMDKPIAAERYCLTENLPYIRVPYDTDVWFPVAPVVQVTVTGRAMTASWEPVEGASKYEYSLQNLTDHADDGVMLHDHEAVTGELSVTVTDLEPGKYYRLQVWAIPEYGDSVKYPAFCGLYDNNSVHVTLDNPVLNVTLNGTTMSASWDNVDGAASYVCTVKHISQYYGEELIVDHESVTGPLSFERALEAGRRYSFQVGAVPEGTSWEDDPELCGWGEEEFDIKLEDPVISYSVKVYTLTATWDSIEGAELYVYSIWDITDDPDNGDPIISDMPTSECNITESLEFGRRYKLQVVAVPSDINWYEYEDYPGLCGLGEATFEIPKPLAAPEVSVTIDGTTMTASWQAVDGAAGYVYYLYNESAGELLRNHVPVGDDGLSVTETLTSGEYYHLWIGALPEGISSEDAADNSELCGWGDYEFYMEFIDAYDITLNLNQLTLGVGETAQLTYELQPSDANVAVTFVSGDRRTATVDASGLVRARNPGRVNIKARTATGLVAKCTVTVKAAPTKVVLDRAELTLSVGQEGKLTAALPNGSAGALTWASDDEGVATVDASGKVTAVAVGNANVTVTAYNYDASRPKLRKTCAVTVEGEPATVDAGVTDVTLGVGEKLRLTPTVKDADGEEVTNFNLNYESGDTGIATVNANGKIAAVKAGTTAITITANNGPSATVNVTVRAAPKRIEITNNPNKLGIGEAWTIGAKLTGKAGAQSAGKVTFSSSNGKVLGVNPDTGALNAKAVGTAKILARAYNGVNAIVTITVKAAPKEIKLDKPELTMGEGEEGKLTASFRNAKQFGHVTWISDAEDIVTVDRGVLTAKAQGSANITASVYNPEGGSFTAQCQVTVKAGPTADKMTLTLPRNTIGVGEKLTATLTYAEEYVDGWFHFASSNPKFATVNANNGKIKGVKAGETVTISAIAYNEAKVEQQLEVVAAPTKVKFVDVSSIMGQGETQTLTISVIAGKVDITGKVGVTFSSNKPDILEVNPTTGEVTAKAAGVGKITVTAYNGLSETMKIVVQ